MSRTPEEQQNIKELNITKRGEVIIYKWDGHCIEKSIELGMISCESILKLLNISKITLAKFLSSQRFNFCLHLINPSYTIPNYVYLIVIDGYVKIGRTYNIDARYSLNKIKDGLKRLVYVSDDKAAEKALKDAFANRYERRPRHQEFFMVKCLRKALSLFDRTVSRFAIDCNPVNEHVKTFVKHITYGTNTFISNDAFTVVVSAFADKSIQSCCQLIARIDAIYNKVDKNNFIAVFKDGNETYQYWRFHGYIIIVNNNLKLVNISRLWKTIAEVNNYHGRMGLRDFLASDRIKALRERSEIITRTYQKRPLLNGKWAPIIFVHLILYYLNPRYMSEVAKMMTDMIFERRIDMRTGKMTGGLIENKVMRMIKDCNRRFTEITGKTSFRNVS